MAASDKKGVLVRNSSTHFTVGVGAHSRLTSRNGK